MNKVYNIQTVEAGNEHLRLVVEGKTYRLRWQDCSVRLARATPAQRRHFEVSPSGYGIHWPEIDEDLAIIPLLELAEKQHAPLEYQIGENKSKYRTK